ncbi:MAG: long-chain-fatty-acid--CoA ligase [Actinobacteria bacterium]|nr:long-chain-fatty-acid--CoA ligase [Actinomycetota bacterium]
MPITSIAGIIRTHGADRPGATALEVEGRSVSFAELDERSNRLAQAFAAAGVGAEDRVAFLDKNGAEYFEVTFALAKLNAVTVAVNWRLAAPEIAQIVEDATAKVLVVGPEFVPHVEAVEDRLGLVSTIVAVGGHDRWVDYETFLAAHDPLDPGAEAGPEDVAFQLYTSGTTGLPKGVMLTNHNFFGGAIEVSESWGISADSVNLAAMPMFHIAGSGWSMVGLYHGCRLVVLRDIDPAAILRLIPEHGITNAFLVPAVIQFLLLTPGVDRTDFSSLHTIAYGASPITESTLARAVEVFGCRFIQLYGLTETTGAITQLDAEDHDPAGRPHLLRSCGKPYPWVEMRVVDPDSGTDVDEGGVGELWTRSPQNMKGYWANEEATRAAITPDGWFRTGDSGYRDADGYYYLHDRIKDMIVSGGETIYPIEVENVLARHPAVADVAVVGVPDERWGEAVKAVVVLRDGAVATEADLVGFARGQLAGFKLPKSVDFTDVLPRNPSGKLLKREIRAPYWEGVDRQVH